MFISRSFWNGGPRGFKRLVNFRVSSSVTLSSVLERYCTKIIRRRRTRYVLFFRVCIAFVLQFRLPASCDLAFQGGPTCDLSKLTD